MRKIKDSENNLEIKNLDQLADLYNEGINNKEKNNTYSRSFNGLIIVLSTISAVCLGIMVCYLIYIYC